MHTFLIALFIALQQPATPPPATQKPAAPPATQKPAAPPATQKPATPQARRPATTGTATLNVRVTDRLGNPAPGTMVSAEGPVQREGTVNETGSVTFRTMPAGTYRVRAEGEGYVTFEKEVAIRAGATQNTELALTGAEIAEAKPVAEAAPPPPAPPASPTVAPGEPRTLSIPDLAERSLSGRDPVRRIPIGCSGLSRTELVILREALTNVTHADADEMLYLVAGEATLRMNEKDAPLTPGWFSIVPRGSGHTVTRRGRNPAILLSIVSGEPCSAEPSGASAGAAVRR
jgi:mannose-6-phosphate isomerase-like protein (cupin superfamily)